VTFLPEVVFRLEIRLPFAIEGAGDLGEIAFVLNVVPAENVGGLVTGDFHDGFLGEAETAEITHCGSAEVVNQKAAVAELFAFPLLAALRAFVIRIDIGAAGSAEPAAEAGVDAQRAPGSAKVAGGGAVGAGDGEVVGLFPLDAHGEKVKDLLAHLEPFRFLVLGGFAGEQNRAVSEVDLADLEVFGGLGLAPAVVVVKREQGAQPQDARSSIAEVPSSASRRS